MKRIIVLLGVAHVLFSLSLYAHHGKNYLVTGSHELSKPGSLYLLLSSSAINRSGEPSYEMEPGLLMGVTNWYDVEIHLHQGTEEHEFQTEAIAFESRFGIFGTGIHHEESHHYENEENESAFGASMLVELEKGFHEHPDNYELRMIVGTNINEYRVTGNLILQGNFNQQIGGEQKFAFGVRRLVFETLSFGFEVDGNIQRLTSLTFTPGVFIGLSDQFDVKLGASIRSSSFTEENQIRLAAIYQIN